MAVMGKLHRRLHAENPACAPSFLQVEAKVQGGLGQLFIGFGVGLGLGLGLPSTIQGWGPPSPSHPLQLHQLIKLRPRHDQHQRQQSARANTNLLFNILPVYRTMAQRKATVTPTVPREGRDVLPLGNVGTKEGKARPKPGRPTPLLAASAEAHFVYFMDLVRLRPRSTPPFHDGSRYL